MTAFEIKGKVALVTGGACGLGFQYVLGLLEKGARGITLADINSEIGNRAIKEIESKYGKNKAIFVKTDVTDYEQFENAFKTTIDVFENVDILINNAGILNDATWQKEIQINLNGTINGILLGLENYLTKYKSGSEGLVVNISSIAGTGPFASIPVYTGTKFAVHGITLSWGLPAHYDRTKVRVVGVCPGVTVTPLLTESAGRNLGPQYEKFFDSELGKNAVPYQTKLKKMTIFDIKNKVALVTGGASGVGFQYVLALLEKGARGVTLADVNSECGNQAVEEIEIKYGKNKAIFVQTDVSDYEQLEDAFKKTIETFKNIDILINNAGMLNDAEWQKEIAVNVNGTINGILLGLDNYLPKYKSDAEGVIVNISSVAGLSPYPMLPVYTGTKFAIHGMTLSWGLPAHYNRNKIRVVGIGLGATITPLLLEVANKNLGPEYEKIRIASADDYCETQMPEQAAPEVMKVIEKAQSGTLWVIEGGKPPYQYQMPDRFEIPKVYLQ